jgi:glycosyltransferase involved in cell wall biosynthesis
MHVLVVNRHIQDIAGGSENQCHELSVQLAEFGHAVTYAVCRAERDRYEVPYRSYPLRGAHAHAFAQALAAVKPDVIYWRYNKRHLLSSVRAARRARIPFVFAVSHINDMKTFAAKPFSGERIGVVRAAGRSARYVLDALAGAVNSAALRSVDGFVFQHAGQLPARFRGRYEIIHNSYPRLEVEPAEFASPYVLWVSNVKKSKNPEYFIRLARDLEGSGIEFRMVGGIQDSAYEKVLDPARLPGNFHYMGHRPQAAVNSLIRGSLFVAHTCSAEGFPNIFLQAWLQERGVVSLFFDPGDLLTANRIGYCSGNYETFKEDCARLIGDPALRLEIGRRAFEFAVRHCDRKTNVGRLAGFLERVAAS